MKKFIVFRSYEGPKLVAEVEVNGNVMTIVDYESNYVAYKGELNTESSYKLDSSVYAEDITEISEAEYFFLKKNAAIEAEAEKMEAKAAFKIAKKREEKKAPVKVEMVSTNKTIEVHFAGESLVEIQVWLMSDGSKKEFIKTLKEF